MVLHHQASLKVMHYQKFKVVEEDGIDFSRKEDGKWLLKVVERVFESWEEEKGISA